MTDDQQDAKPPDPPAWNPPPADPSAAGSPAPPPPAETPAESPDAAVPAGVAAGAAGGAEAGTSTAPPTGTPPPPLPPTFAEGRAPTVQRHTPRKKRRKWPWVVLASVVIVLVLVWAGMNAFAAHWIATNGTDKEAEGPPPSGTTNVVYSPSGKLQGWFAAPTAAGKPTVVLVHGYGANRTDHEAVAQALRAAGFGTLQIDLSYTQGKKDYGGGGREATEVTDAVKFVKAHTKNGPVAILGYSAGGSEAILAAARGAPVVAVVADSSPSSFIRLATDRVSIPSWLFALTPTMYGWFSSNGSLADLSSDVKKTYSTPTLIIQGGADDTVDASNGPRLAAITHGTLWATPGVGHTRTYQTHPAEYLKKIEAEFQQSSGK